MNNIKLKTLNIAHADEITEWKSDRELSELILSDFSKTSKDESEKWISKNTSDPNQRLFGLIINESELIGIGRLMFIDFTAKTCELGIYIGNKNHRGLGLGKSFLNLLVSHAFINLGLRKINLKVREDNFNAVSLYEKLGFINEGKFNEHFVSNEKFKNNNILLMALFNGR